MEHVGEKKGAARLRTAEMRGSLNWQLNGSYPCDVLCIVTGACAGRGEICVIGKPLLILANTGVKELGRSTPV